FHRGFYSASYAVSCFNVKSGKFISHQMRIARTISIFIVLFLFTWDFIAAQTLPIDKKSFFKDEEIIEMTITTDLKKLINGKDKPNYEQNIQPATVTFLLPDSSRITQEAEIRPRGDFRREECYMPPIKINFKTGQQGALKKLGALKFVWPCESTPYYEQLVLKEYLAYKIYNLVTEKSFRTRLVRIESHDSRERLKKHSYYGFFIEDVDDLAKRNGCVEIDSLKFYTEQTNRLQTTLATLFQYMIGNTDWGVPVYHNIKLIQDRNDSLSNPYIIPYDFDCSGLVNAKYALPDLSLAIGNVRQRAYRGFPRTMEELQSALIVLRDKRDAINSLIMNCVPLSVKNKKDMIDYLDEFYKETTNEENVRRLFITHARRE
ncbi:MAG TPA: hypothetical protein VI461_09485, partial [Chitinophagaceae bacterium]|nr:hypothetical protein [Chitinophagaceae bacterium]